MSRRKIIALITVFIILPVTGLVGLNLYLQSHVAELERALGNRLRIDVEIENLTYLPWNGLNAHARFRPLIEPADAPSRKFYENPPRRRIHADLDLAASITGQLVLDKLVLYDPVLVWTIGAEPVPEEELPVIEREQIEEIFHRPENSPSAPAPENEDQFVTREKLLADAPERLTREEILNVRPAEAASISPSGVALNSLDIRDGRMIITHLTQGPMIDLQGVTLQAVLPHAEEVQGSVYVEVASLGGELISFTDVRSPVRYRPGQLDVEDFHGRVLAGQISGSVNLDRLNERPEFTTVIDFYDVDLALMKGLRLNQARFESGEMEGGLRLQGPFSRIKASQGAGELLIREARLADSHLLSRIGALLGIHELNNLHATRIALTGWMANQTFHLDDSFLQGEGLTIRSQGKINPDRTLDLTTTLQVNREIQENMPSAFLQAFEKVSGAGDEMAIEFAVFGQIHSPETNLVERLFGETVARLTEDRSWRAPAEGESRPVVETSAEKP